MSKRIIQALLLTGLVSLCIGQNENQPYFSLSSARTFASHGRPSVALGAWNIDTLEFRVYRINDPVQFFQQLDDPHQFGARTPLPSHDRTFLERIHIWKRSLRASIRRALRGQFTEPPSAHFESFLPHTKEPVTHGTQYAEAPILNSDQLVLSFMHSVHSASRWETQPVEIDVKDKGVYLVEAVNKDLRAYTILMVSDIVSVAKMGRDHVATFVADRMTGQPISGAEVYAVTRHGASRVAKTDENGIAEFKAPTVQTVAGATPEDLRVLVRNSADVAATSFSGELYGSERDRLTGYVYTDRPVYRPGHTVHFKAILRVRAAVGYQIPSAQSMQVQINDPDEKSIYTKSLTTTANGTVAGDLDLAPGAALGNYTIQIQSGESNATGEFEVQEYKKPEYEVRVTTAKPRVLQGETVQATIDARYYFGEPVPNGKVKYSVYRSRYWYPLWYDPDDASDMAAAGDDSYSGENEQVMDEEGQLDQDGKLNVNIPTTVSDHHVDLRYRIEAHVTDEAKREISGTGGFIATFGSFVINVQPNRYFYDPSSKGQFTVEARDYDNNPVHTNVHLELALWNWRGNTPSSPVQTQTDAATDAQGSATATLDIPSQSGSYRVRATAQSEGRTIEDYTYIWVAGHGEFDIFGEGEKTVQIVPDKKTYRPGETAHILVVTGKTGTPVLVGIEGRDLKSMRVIRSHGATATFDVPVTAGDEPSIFVSAAFVRNGEMYQNTKRIKVPPLEHKLDIKLSTDKPQYRPGDTGTYNIDVTAADGSPVARTDLSLGVVDEAIYAIRPDTTPNILTFFFAQEYNSVFTDTSLNYYFSGEAGKRRMRLAELRPASRLAQLKPERLVQPKVRKVFPDTAFWAADIITDGAGHAQAKVPFADSLTTWRATARGITLDNKVGSATLKTIVRKNLILRLAVPRFFIQGDEVVVSAIVHNYLATDKTARVSLDMPGLDVLDGKTTDVKIPTRGEVKLDWRVRAARIGNVTITGKALTDEESDALELEFPVNPPGVKMSQAKGGSIASSGNASFTMTFPAQVEPGSRSLTVRFAPSIAGSLFSALSYLTSFPYGCVEQTMSSFLPNIIVKKTMQELSLKQQIDEAALQAKIRAGLDRLYNFQHEDGGWGWWETDETHPFMTAYVVAGLAQARDAGTQVNQSAIDKGVGWLQKDVQDSKRAVDLRAYMSYALAAAGQPNAALIGQLYDQRFSMSPYGQALLGLTLEIAKDARAAEVAASLEQSAKQDEQQAWWPATRDAMLDFSADVTPECTAYVMKLLSHQKPKSPVLPKAALWLMNNRSEGYWWYSTKQTAMVIYGLTDYLKGTHELNPNLSATIYVNDKPVLASKFDASSASGSSELTLDESKLQPGANTVRVTASGEGRLYYSSRADYFSTAEKLQKTGNVTLEIARDYFRLAPTKEGDKIVYDLQPFTGPANSGDVIAVKLTVSGASWKYLMIEDPIPAGTEFIERDNLYEIRNKPPWWQYWFSRREMHDDRMAIFQTYFKQGEKQYFYLLKAVNPGNYTANPARVQPMYQPDFLATTETRHLEVK